MESSMTGESQDPEADTAGQAAEDSHEDDLAATVAQAAGCLMSDFLDPAGLHGNHFRTQTIILQPPPPPACGLAPDGGPEAQKRPIL